MIYQRFGQGVSNLSTVAELRTFDGSRFCTWWKILHIVHCKWRAGENPILMSGSHFCIPRKETVQPAPLFPKQNFNVPYPSSYTHISVRDLYMSVFLQTDMWGVDLSWEYINRSQTHECRNWGLKLRNSFPGNKEIVFSVQCVCGILQATRDFFTVKDPPILKAKFFSHY